MLKGHTQPLPIGDLRTYHRNARKGDGDAILASIRTNGLYKPLLVNAGTHTGRPNEILAGNNVYEALQTLHHENPQQWAEVPCYIIDVDDDTAARIVLADNKTSDLAGYNDEALLDLLQTIDGLEGTGFTDTDINDLEALLTPDEPEPEDDTPNNPYEDFITVRLQLPPHLAQQWLMHSNGFDTAEEALEYLLDHAGEESEGY